MINLSQITTLGIQFFLALLLNFVPWLSHAEIPKTITYQGYLSDSTGNPIQGNVDLTFGLTDSTWQEQHPGVSVNQGVFTVNLGSITPFDNKVDFNKPHSLTIQASVGGTPISVPTAPLSSVPYAFVAKDVEEFTLSDLLTGNNCNAGEVVSWDGTQWVCSPPTTGGTPMPTNCKENEVVMWNGQAWICSNKVPQAQTADKAKEVDEYTLSDLEATKQCDPGEVVGWNGSNWVCLKVEGAGGNLPLNCKEKEVAVWENGEWRCSNKVLSALSCTGDQVPQWNGQTWVCSNKVPQADSATNAQSAQNAVNAQTAQTAITAQSAVNAQNATNATNAVNAQNAANLTKSCANNQVLKRINNQWECSNSVPQADNATNAQSAQNAVTAQTATNATTAQTAVNAQNATNAVNAQNATNAVNAQKAIIAEGLTANAIKFGGSCFKPLNLIECVYDVPIAGSFIYRSNLIGVIDAGADPTSITNLCNILKKDEGYPQGTTLLRNYSLPILAGGPC